MPIINEETLSESEDDDDCNGDGNGDGNGDENDEELTDDTQSENERDDDDDDADDDDEDDDDGDDVNDSDAIICHICLNAFNGQDIGSPESCDNKHYFCLECIEEWTKQINTCPIDRQSFDYIIVRRTIGGNIIMKLPISKKCQSSIIDTITYDDITCCEICGRCDREDRLLLCDGCDFGYHCECLSPPIETIPIEEWFCPDCHERIFGDSANTLIMPRRRRAIARTGASEAVRERIVQRRTGNGSVTNRKRKVTKKRRKIRRKSTKKRGPKKSGLGVSKARKTKTRKRKTRRKSKKKSRKSRRSARPLPPPSARNRIATKLGIGPPPVSPFGLPSLKNAAHQQNRIRAGIGHLSLFGNELETYDPRIIIDDMEFDTSDSIGVIARQRIAHRPIGNSHLKKSISLPSSSFTRNGNDLSEDLSPQSNGDLLSQILSSQTLLHSLSRDVTIARDGTLRRKSPTSIDSSPSDAIRKSRLSSPQTSSPSNSPPRYESGPSVQFNEIPMIKPTPVITSTHSYEEMDAEESDDGDDGKVELYSDIESIGAYADSDGELIIDDNGAGNGDGGGDGMGRDEDDVKEKYDSKGDNSADNNNHLVDNGRVCVMTGGESMMQYDSKDKLTKDKGKDNKCDKFSAPKKKEFPVECPKNDPNKKSNIKRPSMKDLFGDSDDDDDENDLQTLIASHGSVNRHYPMKMQMKIVLKKDKEKQMAQQEQDNEKVVESDVNNVKNNNCEETVVCDKMEVKSKDDSFKSDDIECGMPKMLTVPEHSDNKQLKTQDIDDDLPIDEDFQLTKDVLSNDDNQEEGEIHEHESGHGSSRVRRCRHGRILPPKGASEVHHHYRKSNVQRSHSRESKNKKKNTHDDDEDNGDAEQSVTKEKHVNSEEENRDDKGAVEWKRPSGSSKLRSYRDGKPKDEELLFREREVPKKIKKKEKESTKTTIKDKDHEKSKDHKLDEHHQDKGHHKHRSSDRKDDPKDDKHHKKRSSVDLGSSSKVHKTRRHHHQDDHMTRRQKKEKDNLKDIKDNNKLQETSDKKSRHHHHNRHKGKHKSDNERHLRDDASSKITKRHRHHKHATHAKQGNDDDSPPMTAGTASKILHGSHGSYQEVTPLDSKKIFADGDRIVINVNFTTKKESPQKGHVKSSDGDNHESNKLTSDSIAENRKLNLMNSKKDDIFWASPPPSVTITRTISDVHLQQHLDNTQMLTKVPSAINDDKKDKTLSEQIRFLPRLLHQETKSSSSSSSSTNAPSAGQLCSTHGPHTPDDDDRPTPTQDESPPSITGNISSHSSSSSISSPLSPSESGKDMDVYDPEAPLTSPDQSAAKLKNRHTIIGQISPTKTTAPVSISISNSSKTSPIKEQMKSVSPKKPSPSPIKSTTIDIPKSSPSTVTINSPFKVSSVIPPQKQKSPQKIPQSSTSTLMPPPMVPQMMIRPSGAATVAAAIASLNPNNLAQLLQMAQSLRPSTGVSSKHAMASRPSSGSVNIQNQHHASSNTDVVDMDVSSPSPPQISSSSAAAAATVSSSNKVSSTTVTVQSLWDSLIKGTSKPSVNTSAVKRSVMSSRLLDANKKIRASFDQHHHASGPSAQNTKHRHHHHHHHHHQVNLAVTDGGKKTTVGANKIDQLTVIDDVPSSAVEMVVKEKFLKKLNRQERVIEEVKMVLKPHYQRRDVTKEEYKEILRKSVPKICHSKTGEINPVKIKSLVEGYIKKFKYLRKRSKSASTKLLH